MQNPLSQQIDFARYLRLLWKRKWIIIFPTIIFPLVAGYYAMRLPDSFKSSTLILVTPQKVPTNFVPSTVTTGIQERLHTISQQIFSRTRLEQIIHEFNLFEQVRKSRAPEEVIEIMRSRIRLQVNRNNSFELAYVDPNPRLAMLVANKLASLFIEENLKVREQQAIGTSQFLADEIARYREKVREKEAVIYQFKQKYMNELPEQLASNQSRLAQLQNQLQINTQNINAAEDRRVRLQQQLAEIERRVQEEQDTASRDETSISDQLTAMFYGSDPTGAGVDDSTVQALEMEIAKQEQILEGLLLRYTEKHPDIIHLKTIITKLKDKVDAERSRIEEERAALAAEGGVEDPPLEDVNLGPQYPPVYDAIKTDLITIKAEIARLTAQNAEIQRSIEAYQSRIATTPGRQLQLQQLSEDYDNLKAVLEGLINKKLQADLSENLERKQKGEQFKILDPANLPEKPFFPNRMRYVGGGFVAGLALGLGIVLLLDLVDFSVKNRQDLSTTVEVPVLVVIPEIVTPTDLRKRWMWRLTLSGATAASLLLAVGTVHLKFKPIPQAVEDIYAQVKATHWTTVR